jgi:hypothetical protein
VRYQAALRPDICCSFDSKLLANRPLASKLILSLKLYQTPRLLELDCIKTLRLVSSPVDLFESLALHLQLHLRILLKDLCIALPKHLGYPLVRHARRH